MPKASGAAAEPKATRTPGPDIKDKPEPTLDLEEKATPKATKKAPRASILGEATPLDEAYEYVNALYYGPQGSGKSSNLAAMAHLGKVIYINAEGGLKRRPLKKLGIPVENIQVLPKNPEDLTYQWLLDLYWELAGKLQEDPDYIAGICWDSITEIHKKLLRQVSEYQNRRAIAKGETRVKNSVSGDMINEAFTDLSDYGIMTDQLRDLLRKFRDLPCHLGISALERRDVDEQDSKVKYRPAVTPAVMNDLVGMVDIIGVTSTKEFDDGGEDEFQALFRLAGKYEGKDRFNAIPKHLVDPMFHRLVAYVNDDLEPETDQVMLDAVARRDALKARAGAEAAEAVTG